jgi:hypothetical protein
VIDGETRYHGIVSAGEDIVGMWEAIPISDPDETGFIMLSCQYAEPGYTSGEYEVEVHQERSRGYLASVVLERGAP